MPGQPLKEAWSCLDLCGVDVWALGVCLGRVPFEPKVAISPQDGRLRFWELAAGKAVVTVRALVAGFNPQVMALKSAFSHFWGISAPSRAQVAQYEGFR